jgi:alkanesulfonate monooxygenase SsuD/methylene tetrahydromethanopterin reductase-like flavin-dependent oxidoreductase (luciferase family)
MRVYHFSECPYPDVWKYVDDGPIRVTLPSKYFDPMVGADLLNERLDEWVLADELGLDIMINEHRSSSTCLTASCIPPLAMMARETKKARLLILGATVGIRRDPVQLAEELAYIDVVSRGRLDMGLVKGYSAEIAPSNMNPASVTRRYWEAHDLIVKAMSMHDGPFNWEGEFFNYRQVNIWPRAYQQPHPPVWVTCFSPGSASEVADRGHVVSGSGGSRSTRAIFDAYRKRSIERGRPNPPLDRFSYMGLIGVGNSPQEGLERLEKIRGWVWSSAVTPEQFANPPGFNPISVNVQMMKTYPNGDSPMTKAVGQSGKVFNPAVDPVENLIDSGMGFAGTPDMVFEQLKAFYNYVGGFGSLLAMMHGGTLSHGEATDSMKLFAKDVLPRLRELPSPQSQDRAMRAAETAML